MTEQTSHNSSLSHRIIMCLALICLFAGCCLFAVTRPSGTHSLPVSGTQFCFDTVVTVTLEDGDGLTPDRADQLLTQCFALCQTYENMLSRTREGSDVWRINHSGGKPVQVSDDTLSVIRTALEYSRLTDGILDITIAPVKDLWDFTPEGTHTLPTDDSLEEALSHVDYRNLIVENNTVMLSDPEAAIDLGCIAKGYIANRLKEYLVSEGVTSAILNLGGNVLAIGGKPSGDPFVLGIRRPFADSSDSIAAIETNDRSLVSSGVYERYFVLNSRRYHHLLNPHTGMPQENHLLSVTILSDSSTDGDALSTVCFLLGPEKGLELIETLPETEAVFITDDYELHLSSGLRCVTKSEGVIPVFCENARRNVE